MGNKKGEPLIFEEKCIWSPYGHIKIEHLWVLVINIDICKLLGRFADIEKRQSTFYKDVKL